jgi:hypothetical protein
LIRIEECDQKPRAKELQKAKQQTIQTEVIEKATGNPSITEEFKSNRAPSNDLRGSTLIKLFPPEVLYPTFSVASSVLFSFRVLVLSRGREKLKLNGETEKLD